jgi:hypothetical protein
MSWVWDRSGSWRIERSHWHHARVRVRFAGGRPTVASVPVVERIAE